MGAEDLKIGFNLLIGSFSLSVRLGVVGRGEMNVVFKDMGKFTSKGRGKLRASVRDDGVVQAKVFEYIVEKELGNSICVDCLATRGENYPLSKAMVDHDHSRIKAVGWGKISNEVNRELLEGKGGGGGDRGEWWSGRMGDNLVLLAYSAASSKLGDKN